MLLTSYQPEKLATSTAILGQRSLLRLLLLPLGRRDLAKHHNTVAVQEGDARQTLAVLEGVHHQRLLRHEVALRHLVGLQRMRVLHLLATRLLADLPDDLRDAARGTPAAHEPDRRITDLDLTGDVQNLDLGIEIPGRSESRVLLVH